MHKALWLAGGGLFALVVLAGCLISLSAPGTAIAPPYPKKPPGPGVGGGRVLWGTGAGGGAAPLTRPRVIPAGVVKLATSLGGEKEPLLKAAVAHERL